MNVVAVPACNEEAHIRRCLRALDAQVGAQLDHIVLLLNNTSDASEAAARGVSFRPGTQLHILNVALPPDRANAGHARKRAMDAAASLAGPDDLILTTDADGEVMPDWLAAICAEISAGADVVAGWVALHPQDWLRIPMRLHEDDARECAYDALCDAIHARFDPDAADPAPRHTQHSGASIALKARAFALCGGVPDVPSGEDRALIAALRRVDARIRHSPGVHVSVSGRFDGRAPGGMADTIRRRMTTPDLTLDDRLEPAIDCARRARARAAARRCYLGADASALAAGLLLPRVRLETLLAQRWFGMAWDAIERESPVLRHRLVPVSDLPAQMAAARAILAGRDAPDDRRDNVPLAPEEMA